MKVVLIGITGRVGSRLANGLRAREHIITGIALDIPRDVPAGLMVLAADAARPDILAPCLADHDAVISTSRSRVGY